MNTESTITEFVSRPKVHRLPFLSSAMIDKNTVDKANLRRNYKSSIVVISGIAIFVVAFSFYQYKIHIDNRNVQLLANFNNDDEAKLALLLNANEPASNGTSDSSVYINESDGVIIGNFIQFHRDDADIETASSSKVENKSGHDLMSILNKF